MTTTCLRSGLRLSLVAAAVLAGCGGETSAATASAPQGAPPAAALPPPPEKTPIEKILEVSSLAEAIDQAKPLMSDTVDDVSPGAYLLGAWSAKNMKWAELNAVPETRQALIMKDADAERGKRICASGQLIEISAEKTDVGKFYGGGIFNGGFSSIVRFLAVGSTGELVAQSRGRYCGIVIGTQSYSNSGGGTTHTAYTVGMFDLPENKAALQ